MYTQIFKTYHLDIESPRIQLSESAWIENSPEFANKPHKDYSFAAFFSHVADDPQFGLMKFYEMLVASPIILRTVHTKEESEKRPL